MTRIFNFIMLLLLAGIYYVQNDGFGPATAKISKPAVVVEQEIPPTEEASNAVVTVSARQFATDALPETAPDVMSPAELAIVKERFDAKTLLSSTLTRDVPLMATNKEIPSQDPVLLVSGSVVNARSAPNTESDVLARLTRGTEVAATGATQGAWAEVMVLDTGDTVWMHSQFLREQL